MVIANINSLHCLNPNHNITIYCDAVCYEHLINNREKTDYPLKTAIQNSFKEASKPWQYYKIDTLIEASKNNQILTDADGIWHDDPLFDKERITLLVVANTIQAQPLEYQIAKNILPYKNVDDFNHYVSGFVSIPSKYMTPALENNLREFNDKIHTTAFTFLDTPEKKKQIQRLSEELSISLSLQSHYQKSEIITLKEEDGPNSKNSLESLYYGCLNDVIE